jgi:hypothetical protein
MEFGSNTLVRVEYGNQDTAPHLEASYSQSEGRFGMVTPAVTRINMHAKFIYQADSYLAMVK